jgi:hypothetical protein
MPPWLTDAATAARKETRFGRRRNLMPSNPLDPLPSQCSTKDCGIFSISIHDEEPGMPKERLLNIGEIARHLRHPRIVRMRSNPRNLHRSARQVEYKQNVARP